MKILAKTKLNKLDCYYAKTKIMEDLVERIPSENLTKMDKNYIGVLRLLQGKEVSLTFIDPQNLIARTREGEILDAWKSLSENIKQKFFYLDKNGESTLLNEIIKIFGSGRVGFAIQSELSMAQIEESIKIFEIKLSEQDSRAFDKAKDIEINEGDFFN